MDSHTTNRDTHQAGAINGGNHSPITTSIASLRIAPMSEEEKRERQRMHVRRSYYKKRQAMAALRHQVQDLERRYAALTHDRSGQKNEATAQFLQLSQARDALRKENAELKKAVIEYANFQRRVLQVIHDTHAEEESEAKEDSSTAQLPFGLHPCMTRDECFGIALASHRDIMRFHQSHDVLSTGASVFGWRDRRTIEDDQLTFAVKKRFSSRSALELSLETWDLLTSSQRLPTLYSSCIDMRVYPVQQIDPDNVVVYRTIHKPATSMVIKSLFLITRFRTERSYVILFRSIDRRRLQDPHLLADQGRSSWHDVFSWTVFEELNPDDSVCELHFGGLVPSTAVANATFWMLEVLLISLRWETQVVGPLFSIC